MKRVIGIVAVLVVAAAAITLWLLLRQAPSVPEPLATPCRDVSFEGADYIVCATPADSYDIVLRRLDAAGRPYKSPASLRKDLAFVLAMNAGMYHEDFSPVGLYVEDGRETNPLNLTDAPGNFFMKPNGVFFVDQAGRAGVMESNAFAAARPALRLATQSGPMLVIDGQMHPRFEPDGQSKHVRNGVGVDKTGTAVFAISRTPVSLGAFARLFRDGLGCDNALFFDGAVSALHDGEKYLVGGSYPAGPIVAVVKRKAAQ